MSSQSSILPPLVIIFLALSFFMALWEWTDRNLEFVCSHIAGKKVEVNGGLSALVTLAAPATILLNVGVEIWALTLPETQEN